MFNPLNNQNMSHIELRQHNNALLSSYPRWYLLRDAGVQGVELAVVGVGGGGGARHAAVPRQQGQQARVADGSKGVNDISQSNFH